MSNDVLFQVLDRNPVAVLLLNGDLNPIYANNALFELGELSDSSAGIDFAKLIPGLSSALNSGIDELDLHLDNGVIKEVLFEASSLSSDYILVELRESSVADSFHQQRLETLGMLAGGVSHDFNNILAGIVGHISYLKNILPASGDHVVSVSAIEEGANKASQLTKEILNFSRQAQQEEEHDIDLNDITQRTVNLLLGCLRPKTSVEFLPASSQLLIKAKEVNLTQVIVNLILNAHDALVQSDNQREAINVQLGLIGSENVPEDISDGATQYALLQVVDCGIGMEASTVQDIFKPFFSTKNIYDASYGGSGLGLATVKQIVEELGGGIEINSKPKIGTTVSVYLPLAEASEAALEDSPDLVEVSKACEKQILVIDDEAVVRDVLELNLVQLGFDVSVAEDGKSGLELYDSMECCDLLILDMLMPGMSGDQVFEQIRKVNPEQKVLIISGFCSDDLIEGILSEGGCDFLAKPFTTPDLSEKIVQLLDLNS